MELFAKVVGARVGPKPTGTVRVRWVLSVRPACWAWVEFLIDFRPFWTANLTWGALQWLTSWTKLLRTLSHVPAVSTHLPTTLLSKVVYSETPLGVPMDLGLPRIHPNA